MRRRNEARTTLLFFFTSGWETHLNKTLLRVTVFAVVPVSASGCMCSSCLNVPAAVCRKLCDRTQGAEGPLGAAVRQSRRVTVERERKQTFKQQEVKSGRS